MLRIFYIDICIVLWYNIGTKGGKNMRYCEAKNLLRGDEVIHKESGDAMTVVEVKCTKTENGNIVEIMVEDGTIYTNKEIR